MFAAAGVGGGGVVVVVVVVRTLDSMFMPMASPVRAWKRMYRFLPARAT